MGVICPHCHKLIRKKPKMLRFVCKTCKKPFQVYRCSFNRKKGRHFCSKKCSSLYPRKRTWKLKDPLWKRAYNRVRKMLPNIPEPEGKLNDYIVRNYIKKCNKIKETRKILIPVEYLLINTKEELNEYNNSNKRN